MNNSDVALVFDSQALFGHGRFPYYLQLLGEPRSTHTTILRRKTLQQYYRSVIVSADAARVCRGLVEQVSQRFIQFEVSAPLHRLHQPLRAERQARIGPRRRRQRIRQPV